MPYPKKYDVDPANLDPNGIAEDQSPGAAGNLTLNGALCDLGTAGQFDIGDAYSDGVGGVQIGIESTGNISGVTFTVTGKNQDGESVTEDITGPNNSTVESTTYWSQITQIAHDGAIGTNTEVGTVDEISTPTYPLNWHADPAAVVVVNGLAGTCSWDVDVTYDEVIRAGTTSAAWITVQTNTTDLAPTALPNGATAVRLKFDSYSNGAELQFYVSDSRYR
jgi:hypothetical protein